MSGVSPAPGNDPSSHVHRLIGPWVEAGAFPGAAVAMSIDGETVLEDAFGSHTYEDDSRPTQVDSLFDLASVSKVFTSVAALRLADEGRLDVSAELGEFLDGLPQETARLSLLQLLTHTSGLPSLPELHREYDTAQTLVSAIKHVDKGPAGDRILYSSLNHMFLGWALEATTSEPLDVVMTQYVLAPLGASSATFTVSEEDRERVVPTEYSVVRSRLLRGEVHDENAALVGAACGHTGLFATSRDVLRLGVALLHDQDFLTPAARKMLFEQIVQDPEATRSASFLIDDPQFGAWGCRTFSHIGFTGTSLLLVPERATAAVLLSNRVQPTRRNDRIEAARASIHTGLEQLVRSHA